MKIDEILNKISEAKAFELSDQEEINKIKAQINETQLAIDKAIKERNAGKVIDLTSTLENQRKTLNAYELMRRTYRASSTFSYNDIEQAFDDDIKNNYELKRQKALEDIKLKIVELFIAIRDTYETFKDYELDINPYVKLETELTNEYRENNASFQHWPYVKGVNVRELQDDLRRVAGVITNDEVELIVKHGVEWVLTNKFNFKKEDVKC
ncbi:hypothetical protein [Cellulosilyticum sp. WCF-2]|uniref:hypothetical protein n=1 Tax=Cellulosilyticum sp. WCF-2 TaxID=2497860 RepID=UPI000F8D4202|nr:hypothetical protein [Cellulosilyticum sp. WCF-2]QEH70506.1 hypothetical protein EKH84_19710 [Cellulosilyticum sp. WCF-2]